jgi:hypothetical protein
MINIMGLKSPYLNNMEVEASIMIFMFLDIGNGYRGEAYYGETRAEYEYSLVKIFPNIHLILL